MCNLYFAVLPYKKVVHKISNYSVQSYFITSIFSSIFSYAEAPIQIRVTLEQHMLLEEIVGVLIMAELYIKD